MSNQPNVRPLEGMLGGPIVDPKTGKPTPYFARLQRDMATRSDKVLTNLGQVQAGAPVTGRTEGIGTTVQKLTPTGQLTDADQIAADGANFGRVKGTALTGNQVDLTKAGVLGPLASTKAALNVPQNSTNFATVDSFDAGASATIRVYGSGGVGTTWMGQVGSTSNGPWPSASLTGFAYLTKYYVLYDTVNAMFHVLTAAQFPSTLPDGYVFAGVVTTLGSGAAAGAAATANLSGTAVASATITAQGTNYFSGATCSFSGGGPGSGAAGIVTTDGSGHVIGITITNGGSGYTSAPTITITPNSGTGGTSGGGGNNGASGGRFASVQ